jgi:hypothetical protein
MKRRIIVSVPIVFLLASSPLVAAKVDPAGSSGDTLLISALS